jgi:hypothetical protein
MGKVQTFEVTTEIAPGVSATVRPEHTPGSTFTRGRTRHLTWLDVSELASDDAVMAKLWRDSAALVGLRNEGG